MCDIIGITDKKTVVGYKPAVKVDGRYYSTVTGCEYKPGPVPIVNNISQVNKKYYSDWWNTSSIIGGSCHDQRHVGRTMVYNSEFYALTKQNSLERWENCYDGNRNIVILKFTLSGTIYEAWFEGECWLGSCIDHIEEIST